jgi:hypothetical protein
MITKEFKDTDGKPIWNIVEPENDIEGQIIKMLCQLVYKEQCKETPERMEGFEGRVVLNIINGEVRPTFIHVVQNDK